MRKKDIEQDDLLNLTEIIGDLGIDHRRKPAIKISRIKAALKNGGSAALSEIFIQNISLNLMIENQLVQELMQEQKFIDDEGNLSPAISKDLLKLRNDTLSYLKMLQTVQNKTGEKTNNNPLADLLNDN